MITRKAYPEEFERIAAFYRDNDYRPAISPADVIVVVENEGALCGVVRICDEHNVLVLRGMRVCEGMWRQGIGTHRRHHYAQTKRSRSTSVGSSTTT